MSQPSIPTLTKDLDKIYSKYVRLRDSCPDGWGNCITCGTKVRWEEADCGHFIPRGVLAVRYFELNTWLQCVECNRLKDGRVKNFASALNSKYGPGFTSWLNDLSHRPVKFYRQWYVDEIDHYTRMVEILKELQKLGGKPPLILFSWDKEFAW